MRLFSWSGEKESNLKFRIEFDTSLFCLYTIESFLTLLAGGKMLKFSIDKEPKRHTERGKPWYDTKQGIETSLDSLKSFLNLIHARYQAGYDRDERLNEFYVLGRYSLDTCGNCGKAMGWIPKSNLPDIPDVLTRDEFWAYIKDNVSDSLNLSISFGMGSDLPNEDVSCPVCKKTWQIGNCHDTVVRHETKDFSLNDLAGRTLGEVKTIYGSRTDAIYRMQPDVLIRHDRFIDTSPRYPGSTKDWEQSIVKNERGWVSEKDGIDDNYVVQTGDEGFFNVWTYYHGDCNQLERSFSEEQRFREVFQKAGFQYLVLEHLPNQYCPSERCAPWFKVKTELGTVLIGWRKRVINIDWSELNSNGKNISSLFEGEDVTKSPTSIHAWGWDKATDYLMRVRSLLTA